MKLTGKCNNDFTKWCINNNIPLSACRVTLNSLIVDFFDNSGIYIEIVKEDFGFGINIHKGNWKNPDESIGHWNSRQEATEHAILKTNEIYNSIK